MKSLPNIEKSAFRKGEYVGYSHGVWHIRRADRYSNWVAFHRDHRAEPIYAPTLEVMSVKLKNPTFAHQ